MRRGSGTAAALLLLLIAAQAAADDGARDRATPGPVASFEDPLLLDALGTDVPIVLSASRLRQPLDESPAAITVIDRDLIALSGARTIVDLLSLVPGFQVGRRLVGNPVATYHGLAERFNPRLQLIVDGRPTHVPSFGGTPWHELPIALHDIERIEVTRAPNAATFGPNSFSAVVSITTREPAADTGWRGSLEGGGNRFASGTLSYHGRGDALDYRLSVQGTTTDGYENLPDPARSRLATFRALWRTDTDDRFTLDLGALRGGHVEYTPVENPALFAPYEETTNLYGQIVWERTRSVDDAWRVQYYHNRYDIADSGLYTFDLGELVRDETFDGTVFDVRFDRDSSSRRHEIELQRTQRLAPRHRVVYGAALRHDGIEGRFLFGDDRVHGVDTQRLFGHSEFELHPRLLVQTGLLFEHNSLSGNSVAPRASGIYRLTPRQRLRVGYSRGVRTPLPVEVEGDISATFELDGLGTVRDQYAVGNRELDPETVDVFDIGYHATTGTGLSLDASLSRRRARDVLSTRTTPVEQDNFDGNAAVFENRFERSMSSLDLQIDHAPSSRLRLRAAYSHPFDLDGEIVRGRLVPRHTLSLFGAFRLSPVTTLGAELYYVSDWTWNDVRDVSTIERLDLRAARRLRLGALELELALQAELELGENTDYLERNEVEDRYFAKLSFELP